MDETVMGAKSRRKGQVGERDAAAELRRLFRVEARRGRQFQGTDESPDLLVDIPKVHFEVKRTEALRLYDALGQATDDAGENVPVVLYRANRKPWVTITLLDDLPRLAVQLYLTLLQNQ
jgi:hypothetical protein